MVFFDIEETMLRKNPYYLALSDPKYGALLLDLQNKMAKDISLWNIMYYGKNFRRQLTEDSLPSLIKKIKKSGKKVLALTSGYPSQYST